MWNDPKYTKQQRVAKLLKIEMGGGYVDVWKLAGSSKASNRASLMSEISGVKTPQSKSGVNALRDALLELYGVQENCMDRREAALAEAVELHSGGTTK